VQASGLDLQADEQQFCVGRGAASGRIPTRCEAALLCEV
jgi:hypothetical protein